MSQNRPRTDGTLLVHTYLLNHIPSAIADPDERKRALDFLASEIRRDIHSLVFFSVPEHWALRVRGCSADLDALEVLLRHEQRKGIQFIRENPPTSNTCAETPEFEDPTERK